MKEKFEQGLREINKAKGEDDAESDGNLASQTAFVLKRLIHEGVISKNARHEIADLQEEKRRIMAELHEKLKKIDEGGDCSGFSTESTPREIYWDDKKKQGLAEVAPGKKVSITKGEILTDGEWDVSYHLHEEVPREVKKNYVVTEARRSIFDLTNDQIYLNQIEKPGKKDEDLNARYEKALLGGREKNIPYGLTTEKMVKSFLQKEIIDKRLPLLVFGADVYENIEDKIDFIVRVPVKGEGEMSKTTGVQFTTERRAEKIKRKREHVEAAKKGIHDSSEKIDDIVLVVIPIENTRELYEKWKGEGMMPGGPEKLWDESTKEMVVRTVFKEILPQKIIDEIWEKIRGA